MADASEIPAPPPEEPPVEIHKPKPIHSWREFFKEVGTIVLGVCIALLAEQAVDWWHWRNQVADARASIRNELALDSFYALDWRVRGQCFDRQLDAVEARLGATKDGDQAPLLKTRFFTSFLPWVAGAWSSAVASNVLNHMPLEERNTYAGIYAELEQIRAAQPYTFNGQATLWTLVSNPRPLTPELRQQLLQGIAQERAYVAYQARYSSHIVEVATQAGIQPNTPNAELRATMRSCSAIL